MWLINATTRELEYFVDQPAAPPYATLSHTWGPEEVTMDDFKASSHVRNGSSHDRKHEGWSKIGMTCKQAIKNGLNHVWIDTCCIDKSSSAELSESINSMFKWYQRSAVCYAFLSDVDLARRDQRNAYTRDPPARSQKLAASIADQVSASRWFTRGWTLQELLAPEELVFFDKHWNCIDKLPNMVDLISQITRINVEVLLHLVPLEHVPVAHMMSWAADRETTRVEDRTYSLLGLFDVNMPMLYGEGGKAFRRLLEAIVDRKPDASILTFLCSRGTPWAKNGAMPSSPADYRFADKFECSWESNVSSITGIKRSGFQLHMPIVRCAGDALIVTPCVSKHPDTGQYVSVAFRVDLMERNNEITAFVRERKSESQWYETDEICEREDIVTLAEVALPGETPVHLMLPRQVERERKWKRVPVTLSGGHLGTESEDQKCHVFRIRGLTAYGGGSSIIQMDSSDKYFGGFEPVKIRQRNGQVLLLGMRYWYFEGVTAFLEAQYAETYEFTSHVRRAGSTAIESVGAQPVTEDIANRNEDNFGAVAGFLHDVSFEEAKSLINEPDCPLVFHMDYFENDKSIDGIKIELVTTKSRYKDGCLHELTLRNSYRHTHAIHRSLTWPLR